MKNLRQKHNKSVSLRILFCVLAKKSNKYLSLVNDYYLSINILDSLKNVLNKNTMQNIMLNRYQTMVIPTYKYYSLIAYIQHLHVTV